MDAMRSSGMITVDSRIAQIASGAGWALAALGLAVLLRWAFHIPLLESVVPGQEIIKANTALAFLFSGVALLRRGSRDFPLYGLGVLLIGAATVAEYLSGFDLGIDQLLFHDPASLIHPGRMSHITAAGFFILGPGLLLMNAQSRWGRRLSRVLGLLLGCIGFIVLLGYIYDTSALYQIRPHASVAVHTALGFVVAGIALQCAHPREGIVRQIHADTAGGTMLRRLLPSTLLIPFLLGLVAWFGHMHMGWGLGFAVAILVAAATFCLVGIVLRNASQLEHRDLALRGTKEELEEAQRLAQMGSWIWDASKASITWSKELYRIHGLNPDLPPPSEQELARLFSAESWTQLKASMQQAQETGCVRELDLELMRPDGITRWVSTRGEVLPDPSGVFVRFRGTVHDITERKRAEEKLRESEERFRRVANAAPVMIWMSGTDKLCTYFNHPWLEFTGRSMDAEIGNGWTDNVHPADLEECLETYTRSFDARVSFKMEYRLRRYDGEYRWIFDAGVPRFSVTGCFEGYIGSCVDVTELKLAEEGLRNLSGKLISAQEEERKHIARELHDDINQQLALLAIALDQLKHNPPRSFVQLRSRIEELANRTSEVSKNIQALSHRLHSSKLEYLGLAAAMQAFCREFSQQHDVEVKFAYQEVPRSLPNDISLCLFRILQAALTNALKHSGVRTFEVQLCGTASGIHLAVRDTGKGFDLENVLSGHGIGLISMRERVLLVNGKISIQSKPNSGTTIRVDVPLGTPEGAAKSASVA